MNCACGSNIEYANCCARFLERGEIATTPEELMRSRYVAFTESRLDYIEATQAGAAAKRYDKKSAAAWVKDTEWLGLEVISSSQQDDVGDVEFIARYKENGELFKAQEHSEFKRINGKWFYIGEVERGCCDHDHGHDHSHHHRSHQPVVAALKVGRNDSCPCGSGKKFKKCCLS